MDNLNQPLHHFATTLKLLNIIPSLCSMIVILVQIISSVDADLGVSL